MKVWIVVSTPSDGGLAWAEAFASEAEAEHFVKIKGPKCKGQYLAIYEQELKEDQ